MKRYLAIFTVLALLMIAACATSAVATPTKMPARVARSTMAPKPTSSTEVASAPQIAIENFAFAPTTLTVAVGTTVTWVNHDDDLHTVTSSDSLISSPGEVHYVQGQSPLAIVDSTLV